jgi:hypothetical protein
MLSVKSRAMGGRSLSGLLIATAICALTLNLATRYWTASSPPVPSVNHLQVTKSVKRPSCEPKRQHLERDAAQWGEPRIGFVSFKPSAVRSGPNEAHCLFQRFLLDKSQYNRPPPSSEFFA